MKKLLTAIFALALIATVAGKSSADLPGTGWWQGASFQNVGDANTTIYLQAYDSASAMEYNHNVGVVPGGSVTILPNDIAGLPSGFVGSAVASATEPIAVLVNVTNREAAGYGVAGGKAAAIYSGVDGSVAATMVNFPLAKHNHFNKTTTFYLQNAGTADATIDVTFSVGGTDYMYTSGTVAPGRMVAVEPGLAGVPSGNGNVGAMMATSAQPIAAIVTEHEHAAAVAIVLQSSGGFAPNDLSMTMYCPAFKVNHFGRSGGLQAQNTHSTAQDITATFVNSTGTSYPVTMSSVAAGASVTFIKPAGVPNGLYSASVVGSLGDIAAIVNESEIPLTSMNQTSTTYSCKSAANVTSKLSYPSFKERRFGRATALQIQNVGSVDATNVVLTFTDNNNNTYMTTPQSITAGASLTFVNVASKAIWSGAAVPMNTISGVIVTSDQPIMAVANEASWLNSGSPDNSSAGFDKANAVGINLVP